MLPVPSFPRTLQLDLPYPGFVSVFSPFHFLINLLYPFKHTLVALFTHWYTKLTQENSQGTQDFVRSHWVINQGVYTIVVKLRLGKVRRDKQEILGPWTGKGKIEYRNSILLHMQKALQQGGPWHFQVHVIGDL